jgi:hypothetical protein
MEDQQPQEMVPARYVGVGQFSSGVFERARHKVMEGPIIHVTGNP